MTKPKRQIKLKNDTLIPVGFVKYIMRRYGYGSLTYHGCRILLMDWEDELENNGSEIVEYWKEYQRK